MADRYYVSAPISPGRLKLAGPEAHHLLHVVRAGVGAQVVLFDGSGRQASARVVGVERDTAVLDVEPPLAVDRESPLALTLAVALPKGDRQRWLVEKAVELGVAGLIPLVTRRGVAQPVDAALARLRRTVVEASKQCGRNRLLEIEPARQWPALAAAPVERQRRWIAHPAGDAAIAAQFIQMVSSGSEPLIVAIGPEGGFDDDELQLADAHSWQRLDLGPRILRVETAALAVAAAVAMGARAGKAVDRG